MGAQVVGWLLKRQDSDDGQNNGFLTSADDNYDDENYGPDYDSWWWSPTGLAVRYAIISLIFAAILLFFVGGYLHAKNRIRAGKPPLAYHRWMVRSGPRYQQQPQYNPYYQDPYQQQDGYAMNGYAPPPPAYQPPQYAPPPYAPPQGGSKAMADQTYHPPETAHQGEASQPLASGARQ